ncbi:SulP family inorganic anion transporter [Aquabacterium sp.]|uniref:SulP family inorganic anion transporter n=1 Tax=Aquabacterium sp. TaxID=1872578 RepID=UPI0026243721|nr:SulP family inorganic anion transporter [Aquabacterium sp.]MDD2977487.1 SulP family inorganic anion transporter [Aquabacterium sp.]
MSLSQSGAEPQGVSLNSAAPWSMPPPWVRAWRRAWLGSDLTAGLVVAVMLVPQSLAYAMLAGLPPHVGLMASLLPLLGYAVFGSSTSMSVGPAAITSLMMVQALTPLAVPGSAPYVALAAMLGLGSGLLMLLMGRLRMGFLSQLLGRPVVQGFTVASALLIMAGQVAPILGWPSLGQTVPDLFEGVRKHVLDAQGAWRWDVQTGSLLIGVGAMGLLWLGPRLMSLLGRTMGLTASGAQVVARLWPLLVLVLASMVATWMNRHTQWSVAQVGAVNVELGGALRALSSLTEVPVTSLANLIMPILLISLVSFVSSMSVAQTFALKHSERIDADRELLGLGLANVGSGLVGGMAVAGGLSRSVVNEAAGARSPLAGVFTAGLLGILMLLLLPWLAWLPKAALAAVIIMAVSGLVQWQGLRAAWRYDRVEAWAFLSTAAGVMLLGFESGILLGIAWSLGAMIWRHSQPHMAEVGRLPGTEHFRNVQRYEVESLPGVMMVRVDESLDFTNIQHVEMGLSDMLNRRPQVHSLVLLLSAVNRIDHSALQALIEFDDAQTAQGRSLYLAEVKGPVMDRLRRVSLDKRFAGRIFLSAQHAWDALQTRQ